MRDLGSKLAMKASFGFLVLYLISNFTLLSFFGFGCGVRLEIQARHTSELWLSGFISIFDFLNCCFLVGNS